MVGREQLCEQGQLSAVSERLVVIYNVERFIRTDKADDSSSRGPWFDFRESLKLFSLCSMDVVG